MAAFRTITNSVATVLRNFPLTYVHYVSIDYFSVSLVGILWWPTTVTAKANRSRQFVHGKSKSLTAKTNSLTAKANQFIAMFLPSGVHQFGLVCLYLRQLYSLPNNFWFLHAFIKFSIPRQRPEANKHDMYPQFRN